MDPTMTVAAEDAPTRRRRPKLAVEDGNHSESQQDGFRRTRKRKRRTNASTTEEPFVVLVCKVGLFLLALSLFTWNSYRFVYPYQPPPTYDDDTIDDDYDSGRGQQQQQQQQADSNGKETHIQAAHGAAITKKDDDDDFTLADEQANLETTPPPLPTWELGTASQFDAFSLAETYDKSDHTNNNNNTTSFWRAAAGLRRKFAAQYGGDNAARAILERGLTTGSGSSSSSNNETLGSATAIPRDLQKTACRIHAAATAGRDFHMAFGGYSVTVGRGNYFRQSFPLVLEKNLHTVFSLLGVPLQVKNAAIGGCPALPYGWCMSNFWGTDADVVSWDYSMNEAGGVPEGLDAYLRHVQQLPNKPALIVKDTHMADARRNLLQQYYEHSSSDNNNGSDAIDSVLDYVVIHTDPAAQPFLDLQEEHRPVGFTEWRKFGSPPGAPGQALHHPAVKEHEFIAWLLTMHFLRALELVAVHRQEAILQCPTENASSEAFLPPPIVDEAINSTRPWTSILFGEKVSDSNSPERWRMNPVRCRTSFEPIQSGDLSAIAVSGTVGEALDIMLPKSKMFYNRAWVLDLSDGEKQAKRKLDVFGGLGYVDRKKAYYGIFPSGPLRFLLPFESSNGSSRTPAAGDKAVDWFKSVVVCEVNEKRDSGACQSQQDVAFVVGGSNVTDATTIDAAGTLYLGKTLCLYIRVPEQATLTSRNELKKNETTLLVLPPDQRNEMRDAVVGLTVDVSVTNRHILQRDQACSISHVVWEQQTRSDDNEVPAPK